LWFVRGFVRRVASHVPFSGGVTRCHPKLIQPSMHHPTTHDDASTGCVVTPVHPRTEAPEKAGCWERDAVFSLLPLSPTSRPPPPGCTPLIISHPLGAGAMRYVDIASITPTLSSTDPIEIATECVPALSSYFVSNIK